jgi:hypothetical protein
MDEKEIIDDAVQQIGDLILCGDPFEAIPPAEDETAPGYDFSESTYDRLDEILKEVCRRVRCASKSKTESSTEDSSS